MESGISQRAYAKHRGVARSAVQRAIKDQRITTLADGTLDPERADTEWAANSVARMPNGNGYRPPPEKPAARETDGYQSSRAVREAYRARREKMSFERAIGLLVPAEEVERAAFTASRATRDAFLKLPRRVATDLATAQTPLECERIITQAVRDVLQELGNGAPGAVESREA